MNNDYCTVSPSTHNKCLTQRPAISLFIHPSENHDSLRAAVVWGERGAVHPSVIGTHRARPRVRIPLSGPHAE